MPVPAVPLFEASKRASSVEDIEFFNEHFKLIGDNNDLLNLALTFKVFSDEDIVHSMRNNKRIDVELADNKATSGFWIGIDFSTNVDASIFRDSDGNLYRLVKSTNPVKWGQPVIQKSDPITDTGRLLPEYADTVNNLMRYIVKSGDETLIKKNRHRLKPHHIKYIKQLLVKQ